MFEIKLKIDTPATTTSDGMWVQIFRAFDVNGLRSHEIILDSEKKLSILISENEKIRIDCSVTMDDAYVFSKLQVNGQDVRTGEVMTVDRNLEIFAKSEFINYKLYNNVQNCVVKRNGQVLQDKSTIHYDDVLTIESGGEIIVNRKKYGKFPLEFSVFSDVVIKSDVKNS